MSLSASEVLWAWYNTAGVYPPTETQLRNDMENYDTLGDLEDQLRADQGVTGRSPTGPRTLPHYAQERLTKELGAKASYLSVPELTPILIQGTAEGWAPDKIQSHIESTAYWRNTTSKQRQWELLSEEEQRQTIGSSRVQVMETLRQLYGPEVVEQRGWNLNDPKVQGWAEDLASGRQTLEMFTFAHRRAAEGVEGTPSHTSRLDEFRRAGQAQVQQEDLRGELEGLWRSWMGSNVDSPDLSTWAENIYMNRRSRQDFEDFVRQASAEMYPGKPEHVPLEQFAQGAKQLISSTLELGHVRDEDPLVQSYLRGEIPSLADLQQRVFRDPRYGRTRRNVEQNRQMGHAIASRWGFE